MQTRAALLSAATAGAIALFGVGVAAPAITRTSGSGTPAHPAAQPAPAATQQHPAAQPTTPKSTSSLVGPDLATMTGMIQALATTSHNVNMTTSSSSVSGSVDPANAAAHAVAKSSGLEISEVVERGSVFVRANLGTDLNKQVGIKPGTWMRLDPAQITAENQLLLQPDGSDPVDMAGIMTGVTAIRQIDASHLVGTIDLTRITGHTRPDPDEVAKAGAAAKKVPFAITADPLGRITRFTVDASAFDPILSLRVIYSDYGAGTPIATPPASVPAPQNVYSLFNN